MWASALPVKSQSRHMNASKYIVACQETAATNEWPTIVGTPTQKDTVRRVLAGILETHKQVVIKLSTAHSIYKEYRIADELCDIPGFIRPHCYFECEDTQSSMKVLVLPFFEEGSMRSWNWAKKPTALLQSCLSQCIGSLLQAYESKGILHSDTHLDNVLLRKTTVNLMVYSNKGLETICVEMDV
jgi:serine/threonine protein kinase